MDFKVQKVTLLPDEGLTKIVVRTTKDFIRELAMFSNNNLVMSATTSQEDGEERLINIPTNVEVIGCYGFVDEDSSLRALGLFVFKH
jgi:hypothetical protein